MDKGQQGVHLMSLTLTYTNFVHVSQLKLPIIKFIDSTFVMIPSFAPKTRPPTKYCPQTVVV